MCYKFLNDKRFFLEKFEVNLMNFDSEITCYLFQTCTTIAESPQHIICFKKKIESNLFSVRTKLLEPWKILYSDEI